MDDAIFYTKFPYELSSQMVGCEPNADGSMKAQAISSIDPVIGGRHTGIPFPVFIEANQAAAKGNVSYTGRSQYKGMTAQIKDGNTTVSGNAPVGTATVIATQAPVVKSLANKMIDACRKGPE